MKAASLCGWKEGGGGHTNLTSMIFGQKADSYYMDKDVNNPCLSVKGRFHSSKKIHFCSIIQ